MSDFDAFGEKLENSTVTGEEIRTDAVIKTDTAEERTEKDFSSVNDECASENAHSGGEGYRPENAMQQNTSYRPQGNRPYGEGYRPQNTVQQNTGYRPQGTRPYGEGYRPQNTVQQNTGYRPQGNRPYGEGYRPQNTVQQNTGYRPQGTRPYGEGYRPQNTVQQNTGYRPRGTRPYGEGYRPQNAVQQNTGYRPQGTRPYGEGYRPESAMQQRTVQQNTAVRPQSALAYDDYYLRQPVAHKNLKSKKFFDKDIVPLVLSTGFIGIGLCLIMVLQTVLSAPLTMFPSLNEAYFDNYLFFIVSTLLLSTLSIALPFIGVYLILRRLGVYSEPLPFGKIRKGSSPFLLIVAGMGFCYFGNIVTSMITILFELFGISFYSTSEGIVSGMLEPDGTFESIVTMLCMAVMPALFEEFVFRGVIMQPLRRYGDWFAILVSATIFALIHGNMTQTPFAFIAGIALGYVAIVSGSLWTSVILHFCNNFLATLNSFIVMYLSEEGFMTYSVLSLYGIMIVGFVAFIALFVKNRSLLRLRKGDKGDVSFIRKQFFTWLNPPLALGLAILAGTVLLDMVLAGLAESFM